MAAPAARAEVVRAFLDAAEGLDCAGFCSSRGHHHRLRQLGRAAPGGQRLVRRSGRRGALRACWPVPPRMPAPHRGPARARRRGGAPVRDRARGHRRRRRRHPRRPDGARGGRGPRRRRPRLVAGGAAAVGRRPTCWRSSRSTGSARGRSPRGGRSPGSANSSSTRRLTLVCDPLDPRMPALPFDAEGTPRRTFELVREGVTTELAADRRDARKRRHREQRLLIRRRGAGGGVAPAVGLHPGSMAEDELLGGLGRALLVHDFWYTRVLDPRPLTVTGLTRNGVFVVEDGVVVAACAQRPLHPVVRGRARAGQRARARGQPGAVRGPRRELPGPGAGPAQLERHGQRARLIGAKTLDLPLPGDGSGCRHLGSPGSACSA